MAQVHGGPKAGMDPGVQDISAGSRGGLGLLTAWRLAVAACGFTAYTDVAVRMGDPLRALEDLSHVGSFAAGCVFLVLAVYPYVAAGRRPEPRSGWARGATAVALLLIAVVWHTLMDGLETGYLTTSSLFAHLVTPLAVLADWLLVGRNQARARWWYPLTWTLPLLAYLVFMVYAGVDSYSDFLDPESDDFLATVGQFTAAVTAAGYALLGLARLRRGSGQEAAATAA